MTNQDQEIQALHKEIADLKSQLANEKISNLEFDLSHKETLQKCENLQYQLAELTQQQFDLSQTISTLDTEKNTLKEENIRLKQQNDKLKSLLRQKSKMNQNDEDEFHFDDVLKFDDDNQGAGSSSDMENKNQSMRHQLLEVQMEHEQLKKEHRKSITKIEEYELEYAQGQPPDTSALRDEIRKLNEKIAEMRVELKKEKRKNDSLDRERRNSLAQLSQNMFKKLLDSEHQHFDNNANLDTNVQQLLIKVETLEKSKQDLIINTSNTINELRSMVRDMGRFLAAKAKHDKKDATAL